MTEEIILPEDRTRQLEEQVKALAERLNNLENRLHGLQNWDDIIAGQVEKLREKALTREKVADFIEAICDYMVETHRHKAAYELYKVVNVIRTVPYEKPTGSFKRYVKIGGYEEEINISFDD